MHVKKLPQNDPKVVQHQFTAQNADDRRMLRALYWSITRDNSMGNPLSVIGSSNYDTLTTKTKLSS